MIGVTTWISQPTPRTRATSATRPQRRPYSRVGHAQHSTASSAEVQPNRELAPIRIPAQSPQTKRGFHFIGLVFVGSAIVERAPTLTSQEN